MPMNAPSPYIHAPFGSTSSFSTEMSSRIILAPPLEIISISPLPDEGTTAPIVTLLAPLDSDRVFTDRRVFSLPGDIERIAANTEDAGDFSAILYLNENLYPPPEFTGIVSRGVHPSACIASISSERFPDRAFLPSALFANAGANFAASASFAESGFSKSSLKSSAVAGAASAWHAQSAKIAGIGRVFSMMFSRFCFAAPAPRG